MNLSLYSVLVGNVYTLTAVVTGGVGPYTITWTPNVPNRAVKTGSPITRSFSTGAAPWSDTVVARDATGATATAVIHLDTVTDSPPPPPPPVNPQIAITAAIETGLLAVPIGGQVDLVGPGYVTTLTRT